MKKAKDGNKDEQVPEVTDEEIDTFFLAFIGELVEMSGSFQHNGTEADIRVMGYILDMDNDYYFLGDTPEEITRAVKKDIVVYIEILNPDNQYQELLEQMEVPKNEAAKN